ncbi:MAG TPA: lysozyme [Rhodocyclaceae bacterium]|nr:lysozyme [Rhodocyclaceae bacterium]
MTSSIIPAALLALIRKFEGLRLRAYRCPAGIPTIGYGHTGPDVSMDMSPIDSAKAEDYLHADADIANRAAGNLSPALWLDDARRAAIADFVFNLGASRYKASTLRRRIDSGDWDGAAEELAKWVWGGGRRLPGLIARRADEARLINGK